MDRRRFLRLLGGAAVASTVGLGWPRPVAAREDGMHPRLAWELTATEPVLSVPSTGDPNTQRMFPTLLRARSYLSDPIDDWYLWLWTHDTSRIYLYTAPRAEGPYTGRGFGVPPTPYPLGYRESHFSSGDVAWDPIGGRLVSSPHGIRIGRLSGNAAPAQDSFLISSIDGLQWSWLDGDNRPRLRCGPPGSPDSTHTGYGRLLRDLDGQLCRFDGHYWWFYRAQREDEPIMDQRQPAAYTPYLASAPTLADDFGANRKAFDTAQASTNLFDAGSFVRGGRTHYVFQVQGSSAFVPTGAFFNKTGEEDMTFLPQAMPLEMPNPSEGAVMSGGPNIVRDITTGRQYAVQASLALEPARTDVWVYRNVDAGA